MKLHEACEKCSLREELRKKNLHGPADVAESFLEGKSCIRKEFFRIYQQFCLIKFRNKLLSSLNQKNHKLFIDSFCIAIKKNKRAEL